MNETDLEQEVESWNPYRRAFNKEHRVVFDAMMEHGREHFPEAVASGKRIPVEAIIMGILIEQDKEIQDLKKYRLPEILFSKVP